MLERKYKTAGLFFIIPLFLFLTSCSPQKQGLLVCFGDSLTAGYKVNKSDSYPVLLAKKIPLKVRNEGSTGETTTAASRRINDILALTPTHIIIEYGANDFFLGTPSMDFEKNIRIIIDACIKQNVKIALVQVFDRTIASSLSGNSEKLMEEYIGVFEKLAADYPIVLVTDIWSNRFFDPTIKADDFHPNEKGHTLIAETIYRHLQSADFFR